MVQKRGLTFKERIVIGCFVLGKFLRYFMFITFEGLDFSGKTTQAELLVSKLREHPLPGARTVRPVCFVREPGGTRISERLRDILLDRKNLELNDIAELMLFSASRAQLVAEVIRPALLRGEIVIGDRFYDSTTAYQGYGRGLDLTSVHQINAIATSGLVPDRTIVVDIPLEEIARRKALAGLAFDRMESSGRVFYERVRNGYLDLVRLEPRRFVCVDGTASISRVEEDIWGALTRLEQVPAASAKV
jgi:dTMP kinase